MESIVARIVESKLSKWMKSFKRDQFKLQGRVAQLSNLDLNGDVLHAALALPPALRVHTARVDKFTVRLPSVTNVKSEPMVIEIDKLDLVLEERDKQFGDDDPLTLPPATPQSDASKSSSSSGYGLADKVADGVTIEVGMLNFMLQTEGVRPPGAEDSSWRPPMVSATMRKLLLYTTDEKWQVVSLKEARSFSQKEKQGIYVFKCLEWESLSIDLLPHPDSFAEVSSPSPTSKRPKSTPRRAFFGGERLLDNISGSARITMSRTPVNDPIGLEVDLLVPEVLCPALSEPGLRAVLRCLSGLYACMNRGALPARPKSKEGEPPRSYVVLHIEHAFFRVKEPEFQLELLFQDLACTRAASREGGRAQSLASIEVGGIILRDVNAHPPCTLLQPAVDGVMGPSKVPDFVGDSCFARIYPLPMVSPPRPAPPLLCLSAADTSPIPPPPGLASQLFLHLRPVKLDLQEATCTRLASFFADGVLVKRKDLTPDADLMLRSANVFLDEVDVAVPLTRATRRSSSRLRPSEDDEPEPFSGARLYIRRLAVQQAPGLPFSVLALEQDAVCYALWDGQPVDASQLRASISAELISVALDFAKEEGGQKCSSSPYEWGDGLWRCVDVHGARAEVAMVSADGGPLAALPPPEGIFRLGLSASQWVANTSGDQLAFVVRMADNLLRVARSMRRAVKHGTVGGSPFGEDVGRDDESEDEEDGGEGQAAGFEEGKGAGLEASKGATFSGQGPFGEGGLSPKDVTGLAAGHRDLSMSSLSSAGGGLPGPADSAVVVELGVLELQLLEAAMGGSASAPSASAPAGSALFSPGGDKGPSGAPLGRFTGSGMRGSAACSVLGGAAAISASGRWRGMCVELVDARGIAGQEQASGDRGGRASDAPLSTPAGGQSEMQSSDGRPAGLGGASVHEGGRCSGTEECERGLDHKEGGPDPSKGAGLSLECEEHLEAAESRGGGGELGAGGSAGTAKGTEAAVLVATGHEKLATSKEVGMGGSGASAKVSVSSVRDNEGLRLAGMEEVRQQGTGPAGPGESIKGPRDRVHGVETGHPWQGARESGPEAGHFGGESLLPALDGTAAPPPDVKAASPLRRVIWGGDTGGAQSGGGEVPFMEGNAVLLIPKGGRGEQSSVRLGGQVAGVRSLGSVAYLEALLYRCELLLAPSEGGPGPGQTAVRAGRLLQRFVDGPLRRIRKVVRGSSDGLHSMQQQSGAGLLSPSPSAAPLGVFLPEELDVDVSLIDWLMAIDSELGHGPGQAELAAPPAAAPLGMSDDPQLSWHAQVARLRLAADSRSNKKLAEVTGKRFPLQSMKVTAEGLKIVHPLNSPHAGAEPVSCATPGLDAELLLVARPDEDPWSVPEYDVEKLRVGVRGAAEAEAVREDIVHLQHLARVEALAGKRLLRGLLQVLRAVGLRTVADDASAALRMLPGEWGKGFSFKGDGSQLPVKLAGEDAGKGGHFGVPEAVGMPGGVDVVRSRENGLDESYQASTRELEDNLEQARAALSRLSTLVGEAQGREIVKNVTAQLEELVGRLGLSRHRLGAH